MRKLREFAYGQLVRYDGHTLPLGVYEVRRERNRRSLGSGRHPVVRGRLHVGDGDRVVYLDGPEGGLRFAEQPPNYVVRMRATSVVLVGPFETRDALVDWATKDQAASGDDPRWQAVYLAPGDATRVPVVAPGGAVPR